MIRRHRSFLALAAWLAFAPAPVVAAHAVPGPLDPDHDGTIDLSEAKQAATTLFDKLDRNHEGTLDAKELRGRLKAEDLAGADPDKDKTLTKDEYLGLVEQRFKAADSNGDGALDAKELRSPDGKALMKLIK
jgi:Ca2+-binding EF-hand superfamily protein